MTEAQGDQIITLLENIQFLAHVVAVTGGFGLAGLTWRLIVLSKNEARFW